MTERQAPRWMGVVLGFLVFGGAHAMSGDRAAGLKWYLGLFAFGLCTLFVLTTPGTFAYILGIAMMVTWFVQWLRMLRQSWRPMPRMGVPRWAGALLLFLTLTITQPMLVKQLVTPLYVPTGSMSPTIQGLRWEHRDLAAADRPDLVDTVKSGQWFRELRAPAEGRLARYYSEQHGIMRIRFGKAHPLRVGELPGKSPDAYVDKGELLCSGVLSSGDLVMADRVSYRFRKPKRGEIAVFEARNIPMLKEHVYYLKRVAGLPGERVRIDPPHLLINGERLAEPAIFARQSATEDGYPGYTWSQDGLLDGPNDEIVLGEDEYLLLGDNSPRSMDSRYFGPVRGEDIIGRVTRVCWPFTRINALED